MNDICSCPSYVVHYTLWFYHPCVVASSIITNCDDDNTAYIVEKPEVHNFRQDMFISQFFVETQLQIQFSRRAVVIIILTSDIILEVWGLLKSSKLIRLKSSSLVFVVIDSMPMPICNRFHERLANNGKITTFMGVPFFDAFVCRFL